MAGPVHNSAVYICGSSQQHASTFTPPSPPSPVTPTDGSELCGPIEELSLDRPNTPITPCDYDYESVSSQLDDRLASAIHVLNTEATALHCLTSLYASDPTARSGFNHAVEAITRHRGDRGKLVIIGVGKSGHIAKKLVATFNSLAVHASFLHPTEALHGDLGHVHKDDTLMLITFSGKTPELSLLMPHLDATLPLIILTSHTAPDTCELISKYRGADKTILLPAPIHESETVSFGVSAPTTSTTMALAVGDALAITCARELNPCVSSVFLKNHPGGAIGAGIKKPQKPQTLKDIMIPYSDISRLDSVNHILAGGDVLKAAYTSQTGWLRINETVVSPSRIRRMTTAELSHRIIDMPWLTVARSGFISLGASTKLSAAGDWIRSMQIPGEEEVCTPDSIVAVLERGGVVGVLEASQILEI